MRNFFLILLLVIIPLDAVAETPRIIKRSSLSIPYIALTFDACPTKKKKDLDEKVIKILREKNVPATFFMSGKWVKKNRSAVSKLAMEPLFEIGNHGFNHPHMRKRNNKSVRNDLSKTQLLIKEITGKIPRYFRAPYGEIDERVAGIASELGLTTIQFDLASGDPNARLSAKKVARRVLSKAKEGSIIVFHMNRNGLHTAKVLPEIIDGLRKKGFVLVTVGELLRQEKIALEKMEHLLVSQEEVLPNDKYPSRSGQPFSCFAGDCKNFALPLNDNKKRLPYTILRN